MKAEILRLQHSPFPILERHSESLSKHFSLEGQSACLVGAVAPALKIPRRALSHLVLRAASEDLGQIYIARLHRCQSEPVYISLLTEEGITPGPDPCPSCKGALQGPVTYDILYLPEKPFSVEFG